MRIGWGGLWMCRVGMRCRGGWVKMMGVCVVSGGMEWECWGMEVSWRGMGVGRGFWGRYGLRLSEGGSGLIWLFLRFGGGGGYGVRLSLRSWVGCWGGMLWKGLGRGWYICKLCLVWENCGRVLCGFWWLGLGK